MAASPRIFALPQELVDLIAKDLDIASRLALSLTCRSLYASLPKRAVDSSQLHSPSAHCWRRLLSSHVSQDLTRQLCVICHQRYPLDLYTDIRTWGSEERDSLIRHGIDPSGGPGMIPTAADICDHERGRMVKLLGAWQSYQYLLQTRTVDQALSFVAPSFATRNIRWITEFRAMCIHCRRLHEVWRQSCTCACEFCGVRKVRIFVRLLRPGSVGERPERCVVVKKDEGDKWYVKEWYQGGRTEQLDVDDV